MKACFQQADFQEALTHFWMHPGSGGFQNITRALFLLCTARWNIHWLYKAQIAELHNVTRCSDNLTYTQAKFKGHHAEK